MSSDRIDYILPTAADSEPAFVAEERAEAKLMKSLMRSGALNEWLKELCLAYENLHPQALCSVLLLVDGRLCAGAGPSLPAEYNRAVEGVTPGPKAGSCGTAAHLGEPVIVSDIATDPLWEDYKGLAATHRLGACWSHPIRGSQGQVLGTFAIYSREPRTPAPEELSRVYSWTDLAALAIERDAADKVRREVEDRFRRIIEYDPVALVLLDVESGKFSYANPKAEELFGYSMEELKNYGPVDLSPPQQPDGRPSTVVAAEVVGEAVAGNMPSFRWTHRNAEGRDIPCDVRLLRIEIGGRVVVRCSVIDVSEQVQAEAAMLESEQRFRTVVDAVPDLIFIKDGNGRFVSCNRAMAEALGAEGPDAIIGRTAADFHPAEKAELYDADDQAVIRNGDPILNREEEHIQSNGTSHLLLTNKIPLRTNDGEVVGLVGVARDITQTRQLEEQLRQSQKMEAVGQLAGGVAHDFNNLLTAVIGQAEMCQMAEGLPKDVVDGLMEIRQSADRAADLTRQLLLFSRKQIMRSRPLDLNGVVSRHSRLLKRIIGEEVQLEVRPHSLPLMVNADETMLNQVLLNLGVNARDAMPSGGQLLIEIDVAQLSAEESEASPDLNPGRYARLRVSDTGCGIEPHLNERIFEPFYTTKEVGRGTGLGLATAFGIVQQHRGTIRVKSRVGHGSSFEILLPMLAGTAAEEIAGNRAKPKVNGGTETILLVEDDPHVCRMCKRILTDAGYQVHVAGSGVEAAKLWPQFREEIALLLTDLVMPGGMGGHELAARLREDRPNLKVIYISGYSREIAGRELELHSGENFLQKPFSPSKLLETIRRCLDA